MRFEAAVARWNRKDGIARNLPFPTGQSEIIASAEKNVSGQLGRSTCPFSRKTRRSAVPFRNFPHIFCLLLCTNALAICVVSHPVRSLFVVTLAHSLLLQIAYIGSVFFLVCLSALAEMSKALSIFGLFNDAPSRRRQQLIANYYGNWNA
ncbi:exopolysaccharide production repressor protein [Ensifer aridi]|uniref:exopolysaccharide production repressor protein n=1 Tax=Ensifer aridi TaxID=1708715 RepID=UPI001553586A|nr:exopolysaccharide production repressor protein [Ensifer aridi]